MIKCSTKLASFPLLSNMTFRSRRIQGTNLCVMAGLSLKNLNAETKVITNKINLLNFFESTL